MTALGEYHARSIVHELTADEQRIVDEFHKLYYRLLHFRPRDQQRDDRDSWLGYRVLKCPLDLFTYHEILFDTKPDVIIETGTYHGGSALYLATMCQLLGRGRVITINLRSPPGMPLPNHGLIEYRHGDSADPRTAAAIATSLKTGERAMVILDSDHRQNHVATEIANFAPLVALGCHLIVEDTNFNGHPIHPQSGPGPFEAMEEFMRSTDEFELDRTRERHLLTFSPSGYLLRTKPAK
jgi:cephalosporin hydroxylase